MIKTIKLKKGFSLVELMIVVAVMVILSTLGFFAYNNFQKSARDSKRKADLKSIATAMQAYYTDNGAYPSPISGTPGGNEDAGNNGTLDTALASYGGKVPLAPVVASMTGENVEYGFGYDWVSASDRGKTFALCAQLEGTAGQMWKVSSDNPAGSMVANVACAAP